ncbi:DUF2235 domain-containing protein, partial [Neisseriaceae bacterium ESL0693]|nr:DUF2235 domain-containing protein [Neisseriaceae bacterium ESL0693]
NGFPATNVHEVVYPGVHHDVSGGYAPGDQFRANLGPGYALSQIALHDMYAKAFELGMPLRVRANHPLLEKELQQDRSFKLQDHEIMNQDTAAEFDIRPALVERFNHWRKTIRPDNLSSCLNEQVHEATAWRILRWVKDGTGGYADFLGLSRNSHKEGDNKEKDSQRKAREEIIRRRRGQANQIYNGEVPAEDHLDATDWQAAGWDEQQHNAAFTQALLNKNYSAHNDGWDVIEGAREFRADYLHEFRLENLSIGTLLDLGMGHTVSLLNPDDEAKEFEQIHTQGTALYFGGVDTETDKEQPLTEAEKKAAKAKQEAEEKTKKQAAGAGKKEEEKKPSLKETLAKA